MHKYLIYTQMCLYLMFFFCFFFGVSSLQRHLPGGLCSLARQWAAASTHMSTVVWLIRRKNQRAVVTAMAALMTTRTMFRVCGVFWLLLRIYMLFSFGFPFFILFFSHMFSPLSLWVLYNRPCSIQYSVWFVFLLISFRFLLLILIDICLMIMCFFYRCARYRYRRRDEGVRKARQAIAERHRTGKGKSEEEILRADWPNNYSCFPHGVSALSQNRNFFSLIFFSLSYRTKPSLNSPMRCSFPWRIISFM